MRTQFSHNSVKEILTSISTGNGKKSFRYTHCIVQELAIQKASELIQFLDKSMVNLFKTFPETERLDCELLMTDMKWIPCLPKSLPWELNTPVQVTLGKGNSDSLQTSHFPAPDIRPSRTSLQLSSIFCTLHVGFEPSDDLLRFFQWDQDPTTNEIIRQLITIGKTSLLNRF